MPLKPVYYWHWISGQGDLMRKMPGLIDGWATGKVPWAKCLSRLNLSLALFFSLALYCPLAINCSPRPARFMQVPKLLLPQHILTSAPINILIPTMLGIRKVIWVTAWYVFWKWSCSYLRPLVATFTCLLLLFSSIQPLPRVTAP